MEFVGLSLDWILFGLNLCLGFEFGLNLGLRVEIVFKSGVMFMFGIGLVI